VAHRPRLPDHAASGRNLSGALLVSGTAAAEESSSTAVRIKLISGGSIFTAAESFDAGSTQEE
jgi:hypothetical protein